MTEALMKPGGAEAITPQLDAIEHDPAYADQVLDAGLKLLSAVPPGLDPQPAFKILKHIAVRAEKLEKLVALDRLELKQDPTPLAYRETADTLFRLHKYSEAAKTLEELLEKYPEEKNPAMLVTLANFRRMAEQDQAALEAVREALKLDPTDAGAQLLSVVLLSQTGKVDEAIAVGRAALKADPSNTDVNRTLGYVLTEFGRNDEAIALYKACWNIIRTTEEIVRLARSGLSVTYVNLDEYAKGEAELETLLAARP